MLGSSSFNSEDEDEDHGNHHSSTAPLDLLLSPLPLPPPPPPPLLAPPRYSQLIPPVPASISASSSSSSSSLIIQNPRRLLISCAELIVRCEFSAGNRLLSLLSADFASSSGDSTQRLVYYFSRALHLRLDRHFSIPASTFIGHNSSSTSIAPLFLFNPNPRPPPSEPPSLRGTISSFSATRYSSYLTLNQITPFIRFTHLTANQAILEAVEGYKVVHILDMDIMHGVQWPPLLQAITERSTTLGHPPPVIRITGGGQDPVLLDRTGDRLWNFAHSLGLELYFQGLMIPTDSVGFIDPAEAVVSALPLQEPIGQDGEALAVNCGDYLHRLLGEFDTRPLRRFLHKVKTLKPRVLTLGEREADHNHPLFLRRFTEALDHYGAIFDSLEATLPPQSQERMAVEEGWFGEEIKDVVGEEAETRRERHQRFESWEALLRSSGFKSVALSPFSLSQAKLLLRLHYPSEGYQLQVLHSNCLLLGWKNRPLFSVSSWQ